MTVYQKAGLEDVWNLRHLAMWPDKPIDFIKLNDDSEGLHLGIYENSCLISVLSIYQKPDQPGSAVIRKVCTHPNRQNQGLASSLIQQAVQLLKEQQIETVTLDARVHAVSFYERLGFQTVGDPFLKYGKLYQKMVCSIR
ncbi:MAG: GNAT family N-acetyltransferase [Ileibacterium sp.]|mgnify:FL=1|nr:GNAT family N-acetyltransferase [Ileibacterium sp.]